MKTALNYAVIVFFFGGPFALMLGPVWIPEFKSQIHLARLKRMNDSEWHAMYKSARALRDNMNFKGGGEFDGPLDYRIMGENLRGYGFKDGYIKGGMMHLNLGGRLTSKGSGIDVQLEPDPATNKPAGISLRVGTNVREVYRDMEKSPAFTEVKYD